MKNCISILIFLFSCVSATAQQTGVGTASPLMQLHVAGNNDSVALLENSTLLSAGIENGIYFKTGSAGNPYTAAVKTIGQSGATARLGLFTDASSSITGLIERVSITDNGKTGIGNTTPDSGLTISGGIRINGNTFIGIAPNVKLDVLNNIKTNNFQLVPNAGKGNTLRSDTAGNAKWSGCGLSIGQNFGGGVIFYLDPSGCHGLVAAPFDQAVLARWNNGVSLNTTAYADGTLAGDGNTKLILFKQGSPIITNAAQLCDDLVIGIYNDWYLPSKYELNLMFNNIGQGAPAPNTNAGGFIDNYYWSSTEVNSDKAWYQVFLAGNGTQNYFEKYFDLGVRAIRTF